MRQFIDATARGGKGSDSEGFYSDCYTSFLGNDHSTWANRYIVPIVDYGHLFALAPVKYDSRHKAVDYFDASPARGTGLTSAFELHQRMQSTLAQPTSERLHSAMCQHLMTLAIHNRLTHLTKCLAGSKK